MKRRRASAAEREANVRAELDVMMRTAARWQIAGEQHGANMLRYHAEGAAYAVAGVLFALERAGGSLSVSDDDQKARADELLKTARAEVEARDAAYAAAKVVVDTEGAPS